MRRLLYCLLPAAGCLLFAGCGSRLNTVVGKVTLADGSPLDAELSAARLGELELKTGETVYVVPRRVRVFVPDYSI